MFQLFNNRLFMFNGFINYYQTLLLVQVWGRIGIRDTEGGEDQGDLDIEVRGAEDVLGEG